VQTDIEGLPQSNPYGTQKSTASTGRADGASAKKEVSDTEPSVIDELREKGFQAYVKEIQEQKKEELREKILQAMGLSEEQLSEMPSEQRNQIEDIIAEEIRRRMMAQSTLNNGDVVAKPGEPIKPPVTGDIQNGMGSGLTLINAMEQAETDQGSPRDTTDREDG